MAHYLILVQVGLAKLSEWVIERVPRIKNLKVDALVGIVATLPVKEVMLLPIYLQIASSIAAASICSTIETDTDWTHKIVKCL